MNLWNRDHAIGDAKPHDVVQVADTTAGIPDDTDTIGPGLCDFGNGLAFPVGPDEHVVHPAKDDLLVVLAIKVPVLYKKSRFCSRLYHWNTPVFYFQY